MDVHTYIKKIKSSNIKISSHNTAKQKKIPYNKKLLYRHSDMDGFFLGLWCSSFHGPGHSCSFQKKLQIGQGMIKLFFEHYFLFN